MATASGFRSILQRHLANAITTPSTFFTTETMDIIDQKKEARLKGNHDEWKRLKGVYKARSKVDLELFTGN